MLHHFLSHMAVIASDFKWLVLLGGRTQGMDGSKYKIANQLRNLNLDGVGKYSKRPKKKIASSVNKHASL